MTYDKITEILDSYLHAEDLPELKLPEATFHIKGIIESYDPIDTGCKGILVDKTGELEFLVLNESFDKTEQASLLMASFISQQQEIEVSLFGTYIKSDAQYILSSLKLQPVNDVRIIVPHPKSG